MKLPGDLQEGKRILVLLHEQRWNAAGRDGVFASEIFTRFHDAVQPALLERGSLELVWLRVRGQPVAVAYNIVWDNKVLFYQGGRTLDVPKGVRPGIVLHARLIRAAIEAGRTEYDFLPGTSQYKLQLATASRSVVRVRAAQTPLRDLACQAMEWGITQAKQWRQKVKARAAGAEPPAEPNVEPKLAPPAEPSPEPKAEGDGKKAQAQAQVKAQGEGKGKGEGKPKRERKPRPEANAAASSDPKSETKSETKSDTKSDTTSDSKSDAKSKVEEIPDTSPA